LKCPLGISEQTAKVKQHIEQNSEVGWLLQAREDKLINEAIEMGFGEK
jgi:hypothetical protein